ncbi:MAG: 2-phospho-L-lactate guanylyltransferase [Nitrososphaerales archaeon]
MKLHSITPVRELDRGKSRLSSLLEPSQRKMLSRKMLYGVLSTIRASKIMTEMIVVSPDKEVMNIATEFGARGIKEESELGVNIAVEKGVDYAIRNRADAVVVLPADLPLLTVEDLSNLVKEAETGPTVVMTPSNRLDGTNALLMMPPRIMQVHYDQDSFRSHVLEAMEQKVRLKTVLRKGLMSDIDEQADLTEFVKSEASSEAKAYLLALGLT